MLPRCCLDGLPGVGLRRCCCTRWTVWHILTYVIYLKAWTTRSISLISSPIFSSFLFFCLFWSKNCFSRISSFSCSLPERKHKVAMEVGKKLFSAKWPGKLKHPLFFLSPTESYLSTYWSHRHWIYQSSLQSAAISAPICGKQLQLKSRFAKFSGVFGQWTFPWKHLRNTIYVGIPKAKILLHEESQADLSWHHSWCPYCFFW